MAFPDSLNGSYGAFKDGSQLKVRSLDDIFLVYKSFPILISENNFTNVYILNDIKDLSKGLICPELFLIPFSESESVNEDNIATRFGLNIDSLNGNLNSFKDGYFVKTTFGDKIFKVVSSFLMLNSDNVSIICYKLTDVNNKIVFYCPHSFLTRTFEPETIEISNNGSNSGSLDNNSGNNNSGDGGSGNGSIPPPDDGSGGGGSGDIDNPDNGPVFT